MRRSRARARLREAEKCGGVPKNPGRSRHINWSKLFPGEDPGTAIHDFNENVYKFNPDEKQHEQEEKLKWVNTWHSLRFDVPPFKVTEKRLGEVLRKLRKGRGSRDGLTAEMYNALPPVALERLACCSRLCWLLCVS